MALGAEDPVGDFGAVDAFEAGLEATDVAAAAPAAPRVLGRAVAGLLRWPLPCEEF